jgi:hypothetical protein
MAKKEGFITKLMTYISGELHVVEHEFDRIEDAVEAGIKAACYTFKVYDHNGNCHHDGHGHGHDHGHGRDHGHHPYC